MYVKATFQNKFSDYCFC